AGYVAAGSAVQGDNWSLPTAGGGGGGGGGGSSPTERFPNTDFANGTDVTLSAGASVSGGALHLGTAQWAQSYETLLGSFAEGETYDLEIDVASVGDAAPHFDMGPS